MTTSINPQSERYVHAKRFGAELRKAMKTRRIGQRRLIEFVGCTRNVLRQYAMGYNLPRFDKAIKLAEALEWPALVDLCRAGRTAKCDICGHDFLAEGTGPRRYCSELCERVANKKRAGTDTRLRADNAEKALAASLEEVERLRAAVAAMCHSCEPEGICRMSDCALRPISPLPFSRASARTATPAAGQWSTPEAREKQLAAIREGNARRWAREGERERQSERIAQMRRDGTIPHDARAVGAARKVA